jgi:hypothetical protein
MSRNIIGNCAICNEYKKLSFEHVPPESCFNDKPIYFQNYNNLIEKGSPYFGHKMLRNQGFGDFTLCEKCNKETGGWYAKEYKVWVLNGILILTNPVFKSGLLFNVNIKPLNVLKQILTMFMSADKLGMLKDDKDLVKFLLNPEEQSLPVKYRVFSYLTASDSFRFLGIHFVADFDQGMNNYIWSEISYPPFGYFLTIDSPPAHPEMMELTHFKDYLFGQNSSVRIQLPYLESNTFLIGDYRTKKQMESGMPYGASVL